MTDLSTSTAPSSEGDATNLQHWRERLLQAILRATVLVGTLPLMVSVARATQSGAWGHPVMAALGLACGLVLIKARRLPYALRAWGVMLVIYGLGLWLLLRVGPVTQLYLLACPALAMLLVSHRTAMVMLAASTLALGGVGWTLDLPLSMPGFENQPGLKWFNQGVNFAFVGLLITQSCAFLLRQLEASLNQQRAVSDSLRVNQEALRQIAGQVPGMVYRLRLNARGAPSYIYVSPGAQPLFGIAPDHLLADGWLVHRLVHPDDRQRVMAEMAQAHADSTSFNTEFRVQLADGTEKWVNVSSSEVSRDGQGVVHNGIMVDITARKASEALVWQQAHFDALTRLPNRRMLRLKLDEAMAASRANGRPVTLMLIDLDHFKEVNDTLGHERGDQLLVEAGRRISACVMAGDTVARMGGDEFTVVLADPDRPAGQASVDQVAGDILRALTQAFPLGPERAYVSASLGITRFPDDGDSLDGLLQQADQALYVAKDAGRNRYGYFTRALQERAQLRMRLATDLRHALDRQQFHVVYQPIVCLATGQVRKAEALLRWQHPERGPISPAEFIPIAESTGLINEIGDWVFRTSVAQVRQWRRTVHPKFQISVNRSPLQFRKEAHGRPSWDAYMAQQGLPGEAIVVEITEGLLLDNGPGVSDQLAALRAAGLPVSLDDFGTGYSAMAYLQKFALDFLKIDRSFVSGMRQGDTGRALCKAMIVMAHELGMRVVAEGVETADQRDWLAQAGCDFAQGYLYAKPLVPAAFEEYLGLVPALPLPAVPAVPAGLASSAKALVDDIPVALTETTMALATMPGAL